MNMIKIVLKSIIPPIILMFWRKVKNISEQEFKGPYSDFNQIEEERVWESEEWINLSLEKLDKLENEKESGRDYTDIISIFLNTLLLTNTRFRILDWGGGTGFIWFKIFKTITSNYNIEWNIVDNYNLAEIGKKYSKKYQIPVNFFSSLKDFNNRNYDILYINTSLQYVNDINSLFSSLLVNNPKFIILTRLLRSNQDSFIFKQSVHGKKIPCIFHSEEEILKLLFNKDYQVIYNKPNWEECHQIQSYLPAKIINKIGNHFVKDIILYKKECS